MQQASLRLGSSLGPSRLASAPSTRLPSPFKLNSLRLPGRNLGALKRADRRTVAVRAGLGGLEDALSSAAHSAPAALGSLAATVAGALLLADADPAAVVDAAADVAAKKGGFFSIFSDSFESFLKLIDSGLASVGVPYSYGFAIIVLTLLVKAATYPLSKKQVESTLSMQALQPRVKALQAKYAGDAERLQVETAKLYQTAGVNPLAGCLPTLATIPVFIGLYRALSNVADEGLLTEGFFWIPSLAGPTKLNGGLGWLTLQDGVPPLGWADTGKYLLLPVLLVISQFLSQKIISPQQQSADPSQQQTQAILKFIPLMIGWFSLSVPSGLTLYWFTNNLVTTAQQVWLRRQFDADAAASAGVSPTGVMDIEGTYVAPKAAEPAEKRPTGKDLNARRSPKALNAAVEVEAEVVGGPASSSSSSSSRGQKFRALKAREAAQKASAQAGGARSRARSGRGGGERVGAVGRRRQRAARGERRGAGCAAVQGVCQQRRRRRRGQEVAAAQEEEEVNR